MEDNVGCKLCTAVVAIPSICGWRIRRHCWLISLTRDSQRSFTDPIRCSVTRAPVCASKSTMSGSKREISSWRGKSYSGDMEDARGVWVIGCAGACCAVRGFVSRADGRPTFPGGGTNCFADADLNDEVSTSEGGST
jgi:hypothetical protein